MNAWDLVTWISVALLGPGAMVIFVLFLRTLSKIFSNDGDRPRR